MLYNLQNTDEVKKFDERCVWLKSNGKTVDVIQKKNTRTDQQNKALHLFFTIISNQLNEMGVEYKHFGLNGQVLSTMHTPNIVKEFIWRRIQISLFDVKSTTKINTEQINAITDVMIKFFGDRGYLIEFPSIESLINKK